MAETNPATPPAATQGGIDAEGVKKLITDAVSAAVAPLTANIVELQKANAALQEASGKAITAEQVAKTVSDTLAAQSAGQAKSAARAAYIAEKMANVPPELLGTLGDDPAKFAEQEQAIRARLGEIAKGLNVKAADVGGSAGGAAPAASPDLSTLSGPELISLAVRNSSATPVQPAAAPKPVDPAVAPAAK